jgi:replicative DNA helicase
VSSPYPIDDSYDDVAPPPAPRPSVVPPPLVLPAGIVEQTRTQETTYRLERALLGAVLTVGLLPKQPPRPEDFASEAHRVTWAAVLSVAARGDAPEILPVTWELDKAGQLERAGGQGYLAAHLDSTDCSDLAQYGRLVKEAAQLRKMNRLKA